METEKEELKKLVERIKEHNRIRRMSDDELRDEILGVKNDG